MPLSINSPFGKNFIIAAFYLMAHNDLNVHLSWPDGWINRFYMVSFL
jgi:hypothetical protein